MICSKYPALSTVVDRLLDIYFLLSAGKHSGADDVTMETDTENVGKFLSHDGRQISTRWLCCARFCLSKFLFELSFQRPLWPNG